MTQDELSSKKGPLPQANAPKLVHGSLRLHRASAHQLPSLSRLATPFCLVCQDRSIEASSAPPSIETMQQETITRLRCATGQKSRACGSRTGLSMEWLSRQNASLVLVALASSAATMLLLQGGRSPQYAPPSGGLARRLQESPSYNEAFEVVEDFLPEDWLHQEPAHCQVGPRVYLIGGVSMEVAKATPENVGVAMLGSKMVHVVNVEERSIHPGPDLPDLANHHVCAASPDGKLHVTGGYWLNSPQDEPVKAWKRHWVLDLDSMGDGWRQLADMPEGRGAHGCAFLADGKMYCAGGGRESMGDLQATLFIYDPVTDSWSHGPSMQRLRDHHVTVASFQKERLLVFSGRSDYIRPADAPLHPSFWSNILDAEMYDMRSNTWRSIAPMPFYKAAATAAPYDRHGNGNPNVLMAGGELFFVMSGTGIRSFEEYDTMKGIYYCHPPFPYPTMGAAAAVWDDKFYVIGGGEWWGMCAVRRMMIYDLKKSKPTPCAYYPMNWGVDRADWDQAHTVYKAYPHPQIDDTTSKDSKKMQRIAAQAFAMTA